MFESIFWFKAFELILSLSILVFIHEFGHFMWARIFKVGVEKFYLFFDAKDFALVRWNKEGLHFIDLIHFPTLVNPSDTEYGIGWIPLGGYCAIVGMVDETHDSESADLDRPDGFLKQSKFAQFMILVGGVLNNVILAVLIYVGMAWHWGKDIIEPKNMPWGFAYGEVAQNAGFQDGDLILEIDGKEARNFATIASDLLLANNVTVMRNNERITLDMPDTLGTHFIKFKDFNSFVSPRFPAVVDSVLAGSPASQAQLLPGDRIVGIGEAEVQYFHQLSALLGVHAGDSVVVAYQRGDSLCSAQVLLGEDGKLGFFPRNLLANVPLTHIEYTFLEAIPAGFEQGWNMLYNYVRQFKVVFTKEGAKELGGFGTMGSIFPESWNWRMFWSLTAFISVALAFMNILPIPALDGGHILILLIEAIIRRPLPIKFKDALQYIGFGLILLLMIAVNANDIIKFFF